MYIDDLVQARNNFGASRKSLDNHKPIPISPRIRMILNKQKQTKQYVKLKLSQHQKSNLSEASPERIKLTDEKLNIQEPFDTFTFDNGIHEDLRAIRPQIAHIQRLGEEALVRPLHSRQVTSALTHLPKEKLNKLKMQSKAQALHTDGAGKIRINFLRQGKQDLNLNKDKRSNTIEIKNLMRQRVARLTPISGSPKAKNAPAEKKQKQRKNPDDPFWLVLSPYQRMSMKTRLTFSDLQHSLTKDETLYKYHLLDLYKAQQQFKQSQSGGHYGSFHGRQLGAQREMSRSRFHASYQNHDQSRLPHFGQTEDSYDMPYVSFQAQNVGSRPLGLESKQVIVQNSSGNSLASQKIIKSHVAGKGTQNEVDSLLSGRNTHQFMAMNSDDKKIKMVEDYPDNSKATEQTIQRKREAMAVTQQYGIDDNMQDAFMITMTDMRQQDAAPLKQKMTDQERISVKQMLNTFSGAGKRMMDQVVSNNITRLSHEFSKQSNQNSKKSNDQHSVIIVQNAPVAKQMSNRSSERSQRNKQQQMQQLNKPVSNFTSRSFSVKTAEKMIARLQTKANNIQEGAKGNTNLFFESDYKFDTRYIHDNNTPRNQMLELEQLRVDGQKHGIEKASHANSAGTDHQMHKIYQSLNVSMKGKNAPTKINTKDTVNTNAEYSQTQINGVTSSYRNRERSPGTATKHMLNSPDPHYQSSNPMRVTIERTQPRD